MRRLGLASAILLSVSPAASAATPGRGDYFGFHGTAEDAVQAGFQTPSAQLRVTRGGSRVRRAPGYAEYGMRCPKARGGYDEGVIRLSSLAKPVRIRRDGTFRARKPSGRLRFRIRGRFIGGGEARLRLAVTHFVKARRGRGRRVACRQPPDLITLARNGRLPFRGCAEQAGRTVARSESGRIFEQPKLRRGDGFYPYMYGCLFEGGRLVELGRNWDDETIDVPAVAGAYAGYSPRFSGVAGGVSSIRVTDLRDGSTVRDIRAFDGGSGPTLVNDLVLKDNGSVAWIGSQSSYSDPAALKREVRSQGSSGTHLLDSGTDIDPDSLALEGSTLRWVRGGAERTATLD